LQYLRQTTPPTPLVASNFTKKIRLIFTGINMPGSMDGLALAHHVRGRWPPVKIIVTSGYIKVRGGDLPVGALFVEKPYYPKAIAERINELLAA
jgi:CheY-like chemotaxis protein